MAAVDLTPAEQTRQEIEQAGGTCIPLIDETVAAGAMPPYIDALLAGEQASKPRHP